MKTSVLILVCVAFSTAYGANLTLLGQYPDAKCMDGTPSGYYYSPATSPEGKNKWVINLQGGGECTTKDSCYARLNTPLGSSKYFSHEMDDFGNYGSQNCDQNPDFCKWNSVFIPYCTSDLHSGLNSHPSERSWNLSFAGRHVFSTVIFELKGKYNLDAATDVILSGESAGGIGVWFHLDDLAEILPEARVVGAPIAGFYFFADPYQGPNHTSSVLSDFREPAWSSHFALWNSFIDQSCGKHFYSEQWMCMLANVSFPFISSGSFIAEAQTDEVVLLDHDWMPRDHLYGAPEQAYLSLWAHNMTVALAPAMEESNANNGVFNPACFIHTGFGNSSPKINNLNYRQAFGNWYFKRGGPYKLQDDCGIFCNPSCSKP